MQQVIGVVTGGLGLIWDRYRQIVLIVGLALTLALGLVSATAFAADPTTTQYHSALQQLPSGGGGNECPTCIGGGGEESVGGSLPFTGLDVALLAAVAAVLLAAGLILRRSRRAEVDA